LRRARKRVDDIFMLTRSVVVSAGTGGLAFETEELLDQAGMVEQFDGRSISSVIIRGSPVTILGFIDRFTPIDLPISTLACNRWIAIGGTLTAAAISLTPRGK
jgi:hypothetical protein